jgi:hypothetical protein
MERGGKEDKIVQEIGCGSEDSDRIGPTNKYSEHISGV